MSLMNVGVSALLANQSALTTTSHNIANVNVPGYSRQTLVMTPQKGQNTGSGYIGRGVIANTVVRHVDEMLTKQSNAATAASTSDAARYQLLNQMQEVFSGGESGLGAGINDMMNAFVDIASAPTDATARSVALTRMNELAARFNAAADTLDELDYSAKQQILNNITTVNTLSAQIASLNGQISRSLASGHTPNDLLDARDQLVRDINTYVQTTQVPTGDGMVNLFIGGSQALVMGMQSTELSTRETKEYPGSEKLSLYFGDGNSNAVELTAAMVGGGSIAGLLKFNNEDLVEGRNLLGRLAMVVANELNDQNKLGLTLAGVAGKDLFDFKTTTPGYSNIRGFQMDPASATVTVVDSTQLAASDYRVIYGEKPEDTRLVRMSDGVVRKLSDIAKKDTDDAPIPGFYVVDGLEFKIDPSLTPAAGQSILFQPYRSTAGEIRSLIHAPDELAVASAVSADIPLSNTGTLQLTALANTKLEGGEISGIPDRNERVSILFGADGTFTYRIDKLVNGVWNTSAAAQPAPPAPALKYTSGAPISIDGWSITLTGTPSAGDTVAVHNALDLGEGFKLNAGNAQAFLALRDQAVFDNGTTLSDGFAGTMAVIGTRTQSARYAAELSSTLAKSLDAERSAVSGVNLDEEAARLLQYQQAYQASAKIIQTAQTLFDSVLNVIGR